MNNSNFIPFNKPCVVGGELSYIENSLQTNHLSGNGYYSKYCQSWFETNVGTQKALITPSCTAALELSALLLDIEPGDEIIIPSFTFVSTANAFALRGAKIIFVDVEPSTMNIDIECIRRAITPLTKVIVPVHYSGVSCDMDELMELATSHGIYVVEDAAQAHNSNFQKSNLGSIGQLATFSFHETKNITSGGEGGMLCVNDPLLIERAEIIREKGTDRSRFFRGQVDKYTWVDIGSSYLPSEIQAAYLACQLDNIEQITQSRIRLWNLYKEALSEAAKSGYIELPPTPSAGANNAHIFYIKVKDIKERARLIEWLKAMHIMAVFHYVPLHSSPAGRVLGEFAGDDVYTTKESERLLRLPLFHGLTTIEVRYIADQINDFYQSITI